MAIDRATRAENPAPASRGEVAGRHDRAPARRPSRHGRPGSRRGRGAAARQAAPGFEDRPLPAVHSGDAGGLAELAGQPALRDGVRARLPGEREPLPQHDRRRAAAAGGRGLSAPQDASRRAGAGRLGALRQAADRARRAVADGLRDGPQPLAPRVPAVLSQRRDEQLPARPCRRLRGVAGRAPRAVVRQSEERGRRAHRRRDPVQPRVPGLRRPLPLPATAGCGRRGATRRAGWSARYAMCAAASSPRGRGATSTTSTPRPRPGATASLPTAGGPKTGRSRCARPSSASAAR